MQRLIVQADAEHPDRGHSGGPRKSSTQRDSAMIPCKDEETDKVRALLHISGRKVNDAVVKVPAYVMISNRRQPKFWAPRDRDDEQESNT